ncbi:hypothetical protein ACWCQW_33905 [Streptomyces mirabilis]
MDKIAARVAWKNMNGRQTGDPANWAATWHTTTPPPERGHGCCRRLDSLGRPDPTEEVDIEDAENVRADQAGSLESPCTPPLLIRTSITPQSPQRRRRRRLVDGVRTQP